MISLTLAEHVRMLFVRRLRRLHPLQRRALLRRRYSKLDLHRLALGHSRRELDGQWTAIRFDTLSNTELSILVIDLDGRDIEEAISTLALPVTIDVSRKEVNTHLESNTTSTPSSVKLSNLNTTLPTNLFFSKSISKSKLVCRVT